VENSSLAEMALDLVKSAADLQLILPTSGILPYVKGLTGAGLDL